MIGNINVLIRGMLGVLLACRTATGAMEGVVEGRETLVLLGSPAIRDTHSIFFSAIADRGYHLTFHVANSPDVVLYKYGRWLYNNLIIFAPNAEEFATLDVPGVFAFVEAGGNLLVAVDPDMSELMRELGGEFGVDFDRKKSRVIDHFSYEPSLDKSFQHTAIVTSESISNERVLGPFAKSPRPVVYSGVAHAVDDENVLALKVLTASPTAYSAFLGKDTATSLENVGREALLITAIQGRNNARAVFSGSLDFFSDHLFKAELGSTGQYEDSTAVLTQQQSGNEELAVELCKWAFGERGILRASNVTHYRHDGSQPEHLLAEKVKPDLPFSLFPDPELNRQSLVYRIKDDIVYSLVIEEYDSDHGGWRPYQADDVQLEFVMLDPYVRMFMQHDGSGRFRAEFKIPDVYGVYKFRILYRRPGCSTLAVNTQVSIRPFHHDEYERFILQAYPYYTSAFAMMAGFFIFGLAFLYSRASSPPSVRRKNE